MALEPLSLAATVDGGADDRQLSGDTVTAAGGEGNKAARLPRWTRQEILVLIQGKRVAETRVRRGRSTGSAFGSGQIEPKWASVSSYCKRHGVNRGPVQCRKRWSNLAGDFKKIKEWEMRDETESFWVMRNDLRRERKLPGFFDREVYDILDGGGGGGGGGGEEEMGGGLALALAPAVEAAAEGGEEREETEVLFDSGRSTAADDGLFSDSEVAEQSKDIPAKDIPAPVPISGINPEKQPGPDANIQSNQEGRKRKRNETDIDGERDTTNLQHQLIEVLEKNGKLLSSQIEAQNVNIQLDREQRQGHANSLIKVLDKLADAIGRIADKL